MAKPPSKLASAVISGALEMQHEPIARSAQIVTLPVLLEQEQEPRKAALA